MILIWWIIIAAGVLLLLFLWSITPGGFWKKTEFPNLDGDDINEVGSHPGESQRLRAYLYGGQFIPGFSLPG